MNNMDRVIAIHDNWVYHPLRDMLITRVASKLPNTLTPNKITLLSLLCMIPYSSLIAGRINISTVVCASGIAIIHDLFDRLDGAAAHVHVHARKLNHDSRWGGFIDGMADKVYVLVCTYWLLYRASFSTACGEWLGLILRLVVAKNVIKGVLNACEFLTYRNDLAVQIGATSYGKCATFLENCTFVLIPIAALSSSKAVWLAARGFLSVSFVLRTVSVKHSFIKICFKKPIWKTVIAFGTFDMCHEGHLNILQNAARHGDRLIVGVSSDALNLEKKGKRTVLDQATRMRVIRALRFVDDVFLETSLENKYDYCMLYNADVLVMGDDHKDKYDNVVPAMCKCVYVSRTPSVSTTELIEAMRHCKE